MTDYTTATPYSAWYNYVANSPLVGQILFTNNGVGRMTTTKQQYDLLNRLTSISSAPPLPNLRLELHTAMRIGKPSWDQMMEPVSGFLVWFGW